MAKSLSVALLLILTLACLMLVNPTIAQSTYKFSGYVTDLNGYGLAGAVITLNVVSPAPVQTNALGYFEISAPSATYQVDVWPPFDSNYLFYHLQTLSITSDVSQNFTLNSGFKISGYIKNESGAVIPQARFSLVGSSTYVPGWYSNMSGYYFATAPAGTYTLTADPRTGVGFNPYSEPNIVLNSNMPKNITVSTQIPYVTPTPSPTPQPTTNPAQTTHPTTNPTKTTAPFPSPTSTPEPTTSISSLKITTDDGVIKELNIFGNITSEQITGAAITANASAHKTVLNFSVAGPTGSFGFANITIPKSAVDNGTTPVIYIDNVKAQNQGSVQDANNYYVWFETHFSVHQVSIEFTTKSGSQSFNFSLITLLLVIVVALPVVAFIVVMVKRQKPANKD